MHCAVVVVVVVSAVRSARFYTSTISSPIVWRFLALFVKIGSVLARDLHHPLALSNFLSILDVGIG